MPKILYCLLLVFFLGVSGCYSENNIDHDDPNSEKNRTIIEIKRRKIEREIAKLKDHPWAGEYYYGDKHGLNVTLTLAPENGFTIVFESSTSLFGQDFGTVIGNDDRLKLSFVLNAPAKDNNTRFAKQEFDRYKSESVRVPWGERTYLVPADEIIDFCNAVNARTEPRQWSYGGFFLRGDEEKETTGKPDVPEEFKAYLLDEPVDAEVVAVSDIQPEYCTYLATVVLNKGKKDGLLPGMEVGVLKPKSVYGHMKLTRVEETRSEGRYRYGRFPGEIREKPTPEIGWLFSTCENLRQLPE